MRNYVFIKSSGNQERVKGKHINLCCILCFLLFCGVLCPSSALAKDKTGTFTMAGGKCSPGGANAPDSIASARFDENGNCVVKKCNKNFVLINGFCRPEEELSKANACNESGGNMEYLEPSLSNPLDSSFGIVKLTCFCPDEKFNDGDKCILYNKNDCETKHIHQHITRNNLQSVKKCVEKDKSVMKQITGAEVISTALKTQQYEMLDFLLDNGLDLKTEVVSGGYFSEISSSGPNKNKEEHITDLNRNFELIKHLVANNRIDLNDLEKPFIKDNVSVQRLFASHDKNVKVTCDTLSFLLDKTNSAVIDNIDILGEIMRCKTIEYEHRGFPFEYFKYARSQGLKFMFKDGNNPLEYLCTSDNIGPQEYSWFITEIKRDLPNVDFTNALKRFCGGDYVYGSTPRPLYEDQDIIKVFLNTGAKINDDIIEAAKHFQKSVNQSYGHCLSHPDEWCSYKLDAVCSFVPENKICLEYEKEKAKEKVKKKRDTAHNIVSGASTAMTGIGMMQAVQGFSEQKSDAAAESDMAAHIATFKCNYDKGPTFKYSTEEIIIPGGDELLKYYTEYKTLADQ
ncbi:MAG: hypothetical protein IJR92_03365, partial [Alphaproteobacteria bacterium]|nr:hypothetical protein [Alphaproteobacteria bacterium]